MIAKNSKYCLKIVNQLINRINDLSNGYIN